MSIFIKSYLQTISSHQDFCNSIDSIDSVLTQEEVLPFFFFSPLSLLSTSDDCVIPHLRLIISCMCSYTTNISQVQFVPYDAEACFRYWHLDTDRGLHHSCHGCCVYVCAHKNSMCQLLKESLNFRVWKWLVTIYRSELWLFLKSSCKGALKISTLYKDL